MLSSVHRGRGRQHRSRPGTAAPPLPHMTAHDRGLRLNAGAIERPRRVRLAPWGRSGVTSRGAGFDSPAFLARGMYTPPLWWRIETAQTYVLMILFSMKEG